MLPTVALATEVPGGVITSDTTWTLAGSPWNIQGTLTIPQGVTLTLEPGVSVTSWGSTVRKVEVLGSLVAVGTEAAPININLQSNSILVKGSVVADHVTVVGGKPSFDVQLGGSALFDHSALQYGAPSFQVSGGTVGFENGVFSYCTQVLGTTSGRSTIRSSLIHGCSPSGTTSLVKISSYSPKVTLVHNTFVDNWGSAIDGAMSGGLTDVAIDIHDNIIVGRESYGIRLTNVYAPILHHNVVWGHTDGNYIGVSPGEGSLNANPLFRGTGMLTENSPARNAASDGTDMGAFPYAGAPVHSLLEGVLHSDRTLTGANVVTGDLRVPAGITLTLEPGASLTVNETKGPAGGNESVKVVIAGSLKAKGTVDQPVTLERSRGVGAYLQGDATFEHARVTGPLVIEGTATFQDSTVTGLGLSSFFSIKGTGSATFKDFTVTGSGIVSVEDDGTATFQHLTLSEASLAGRGHGTVTVEDATVTGGSISSDDSATVTVKGSTLRGGYPCLNGRGGTLTFERGTLEQCGTAVSASGGVVNVSYSLLRNNVRNAYTKAGGLDLVNASASIVHNTIIDNELGAIYVATQPNNTVEIRDNIIKSNEYTGIEVVPAPNISIHHNAVWGHTRNYVGNPTLGPGSLTQDPLFVSPRHLTLLETSPCRNAASDGTDMGAFPYVPVPPASMVLDSDSLTLRGKGTSQLTAKVFDVEGLELPHAVVTWTVPAEVGSIDSSGKFTAGCSLGAFPGAVVATTGGLSAVVDVTVTLGPVQTVPVTPSQVTLRIGESQQFSARALDACGHDVPTTLRWVTTTGAGTISANGLYTASNNPRTYAQGIQVEADGKSGYVSVTIQPGPVHHIYLLPGSLSAVANSRAQFYATPRDSAENDVPGTVTWSVVAGGGTIDSTGLFTAGTVAGPYPGTIKASLGGVSVTADLTVTPGPLHHVQVVSGSNEVNTRGTLQFTAFGYDEWGNRRDAVPTWTVTPASLGTIDSNGLFKAGTVAGSYPGAVTATMYDVRGSADVTVLPGPLSRVVLTPPFATLEPLGTQQFGVMGFDADGNPRTIAPKWSVETEGAGTITSTGLYTAPAVAGTYDNCVSVNVDHITLTTTVFVKPAAISRVEISPLVPSVVVKGTVPFKARAFDAYDNEVSDFSATWKVVKGGGSVDASGVFTAGTTAGTYADTVEVTVAGVTKTTGVTVTPGAVSRISISPQGPTMVAGSTVAFSAKAFDAYDNEISSLPTTWKVVNGGGSIDDAGVFTAGIVVGAFSQTVQVTMGALSERTSVSVVAGGASRVVLSPQNPTLPAGGTVTFSVQAFDLYGNETPAFPATWKVVNGGGSVDASGVFTAGTTAGTFLNTLQVTVGSATGTTSVTVTSTKPGAEPEEPEPECRRSSDCGNGETCNAGVCEAPPANGENGGGGGCSSTGTGSSVFGLLALVMLAFDSRRRRAGR
ncbi:right-handed parallel beta-helix repeat-containing protein [Myxococcus sp. K15C18031901]|uniref:right-handed parallel beta-helix repeat-containing protein n=1 Tax=Myxococcus dinghuensis TaxID=2906761 RepID=UPI0020A6F9EB|nr:right-handed parallel beta-helix repeat-containing protein [Myxococcus dinghuensis]MCP3104946.1 right-handed parallel beta-helix repeat-containing protein [Myxococcus dinghuensis]